jgi:hypothetical protein
MGNTGPEVQEAVRGDSGWFLGRNQARVVYGGPEGQVEDQKGKWKAGNESEGHNWAGKCHSGVWEAGAQLGCRICEKGTFSMQSGKSPYTRARCSCSKRHSQSH